MCVKFYNVCYFSLILKNDAKGGIILKDVVTGCGTKSEFMVLIPKIADGFKCTFPSEKIVVYFISLKERIRTDRS